MTKINKANWMPSTEGTARSKIEWVPAENAALIIKLDEILKELKELNRKIR